MTQEQLITTKPVTNLMTQYLCILLLIVELSACKETPPVVPPALPDTTSHSVVWRTQLIGYGPSYLHDVAIIDENNIWAVGEFYLQDSTGKFDPTMYNVAKWNGQEWRPERIYSYYNGTKYILQIQSIIAFGPTDIWIANSGPKHMNSNGEFVMIPQTSPVEFGQVWRLWGTSSSDLFMVAGGGKLIHFDCTSYETIQTGVTSRFNDIYGHGNTVYVASYWYDNQIRPSGVFRYLRNIDHFQFLFPDASDTTEFKSLTDCFGVWVSPTGTLWAVSGANIFKPFESHMPIAGINPLKYWLLGIRGNADNDVWAAGVGGRVFHFNGASWKEYPELWPSVTRAVEYHAIAVKGDIIVLAGMTYDDDHAIVTIGKRMP